MVILHLGESLCACFLDFFLSMGHWVTFSLPLCYLNVSLPALTWQKFIFRHSEQLVWLSDLLFQLADKYCVSTTERTHIKERSQGKVCFTSQALCVENVHIKSDFLNRFLKVQQIEQMLQFFLAHCFRTSSL